MGEKASAIVKMLRAGDENPLSLAAPCTLSMGRLHARFQWVASMHAFNGSPPCTLSMGRLHERSKWVASWIFDLNLWKDET